MHIFGMVFGAAYFCLFAASAIPNHTLAEYSQNQNYSFRAYTTIHLSHTDTFE